MKKTTMLLFFVAQTLSISAYSKDNDTSLYLLTDKWYEESADKDVKWFKYSSKIEYADAETDAIYIERSLNSVREDMLDPDAAKFRNVKLLELIEDDSIKYVCGEVNGKNLFGAYVGYKSFIANGGTKRDRYIDDEDVNNKYIIASVKRYNSLCEEYGR